VRGDKERVRSRAYARATGRLVRKPKAMVAIPEIAAVAVVRSLLIPTDVRISLVFPRLAQYLPIKHVAYAASVAQVGLTVLVHTHVPPVSVRMDAFSI
jgi:hypothetical protein